MEEKKMEIRVDNEIAHGVYSNNFVVSSSPTEFTLDFIYQNYQQALIQTRVILHPKKAEELIDLLKQQMQKYRESIAGDLPVN
ncbi:MAG: DUF3467 domain-containing protein [SAR324 cluster bacterium]|nr:DUF3467 domain-containing protein [SAR324 cluster bacterium]